MRILFVGNTSWSMWNFRGAVMKALKAAGHDVCVAAPEDSYSKNFASLGIRFVPLKNLDRKGLNPLCDIRLFHELFSLYRRERPQRVFQYTVKPNIWGSLVGAILRISCVSVVTGLGYVFIRLSALTFLVAFLYRLAFLSNKNVVFLNEEDMNDFYKYGILSRKSSKVLLMKGEGVDLSYYQAAPLKLGYSQERVFLLICRLLLDKGVREYVEAARLVKLQYPKARFQILGPVDPGNPAAVANHQLDSWIASGAIEYLGETSDVRHYIAQSTCVVLPSYQEGMSRVLMEALAMGRPIIASNIRGCRELVTPGKNGFLVQPKSVESLAEGCLALLKLDNSELLDLGASSSQRSLEFSIDATIHFYEKLIST